MKLWDLSMVLPGEASMLSQKMLQKVMREKQSIESSRLNIFNKLLYICYIPCIKTFESEICFLKGKTKKMFKKTGRSTYTQTNTMAFRKQISDF